MWPKYEVSAVRNPKHMCTNALRHDVFGTWEWEKREDRGKKGRQEKRRKESQEGLWSVRALASAMTLWLFVDTFWMEALEHKKEGMRKKRKRNAPFLMDEGVSCYIWMEYSCDKLLSTPKQAASHLRDVTERLNSIGSTLTHSNTHFSLYTVRRKKKKRIKQEQTARNCFDLEKHYPWTCSTGIQSLPNFTLECLRREKVWRKGKDMVY